MPSINVNLAVTPVRAAQAVLGVGAAVAGWKASAWMIERAYQEDLVGDPMRVISKDDKTIIYQQRQPQGNRLSMTLLGAGVLAAGLGGALAYGVPRRATGWKVGMQQVAGFAVAMLGAGVGAAAASKPELYRGADFQNVR